MIEKLVTQIFATRNIAHLAHWKTKKVAALDNMLQEIEGLYMKTIYKLENLS